MTIPLWLSVGQLVDMSDWDSTEPPIKRLGTPCRIVKSVKSDNCGSGIVVNVVNETTGESIDGLDSGWLSPYGWLYEDELPEDYPYDAQFKDSLVVDGVRMFPPQQQGIVIKAE